MDMREKQRERNGREIPAVVGYAVAPCTLGAVLVAATDRGVCAVLLGDRAESLVVELAGRFPESVLENDPHRLAGWLGRAAALVDRPGADFDAPLDPRGSAFQQRVWRELREIPAGSTASYGEIATRIGRPGSVRAVASACAANPLAIAVPCHRVVRGDGSLAGYRWGVERKRALLAREAGA